MGGIGNTQIGDLEGMLLDDVVKSQELFRYTSERHIPYTRMFEGQIEEMYGASGALMFPSATMAFETYLKTLNIQKGDEVIVSPFSWVSDYSVLLMNDMKLRFCRFDEEMQIEFESIKELVNSDTKMIVIPHLMGRGQQCIEKVEKLCEEEDIILVEDIAQSFGIKVNGRYAGSYGQFAFNSLNHHKIMSTGDGGFGIFNTEKAFEKGSQIHDQGCFVGEAGDRIVKESEYRKGLSLRQNNLLGAVALAQLSRLPMIKNQILEKHEGFIDEIGGEAKENIISYNQGDIPFTALLKEAHEEDYPSLLDSGWHFIENIPYFDSLNLDEKDRENIEEVRKVLESTYAVGTGFIDEYYAISKGAELDEEFNPAFIQNLKEAITR